MTNFIDRLRGKGLLPPPPDAKPPKVEPVPSQQPHEEPERIISRSEVDAIDIEIPEKCIRASAHAAGPNSSFQALIDAGAVFKTANLTPVYFTNEGQTAIRVVPREYLDNPLILN